MGEPGAIGRRLRAARLAVGWTQPQLAARAGVSRQLIGAIEAGRHLPRVDAGLALAEALATDAAGLFGRFSPPVDIYTQRPPPEGGLVRSSLVGDRVVTASPRLGFDGWDLADGMVKGGAVVRLGRTTPGIVIGGCEPALILLERVLREAGSAALAVTMSSASAISALREGLLHAAVVHGPAAKSSPPPVDLTVTRLHLTRWQVGVAAPADAAPDWWKKALSGRVPVVQREPGARVQEAFESAVGVSGGQIPGPVVGSHLEVARLVVATGTPGVTIEPAALAVGAAFQPIEAHSAALWIDRRWMNEPAVTDALTVLVGGRFAAQLEAIGGYELTGLGGRAA